MYPYDAFNINMGMLPPAELAWLLFTESGEPGMYMLYSDLTSVNPSGQKGDRTLE